MQLKIKRLTIFLLLFLSIGVAYGQQAPVFTYHTNTHAFTNPGYAGLGEGICLNGIVRQQWSGFEEEGNNVAPENFLVTGDMPVRWLRGGVGLAIIQDKIAYESNIGVQLGYSYHASLASGTLGIGTALNLLNRSVDFSKFNPHSEGDPVLVSGEQTDMLFDVNLGLFWQVEDVYYIGLSATSLLETKGKALGSSAESSASFIGDRTFYLVAGYEYPVPGKPAYEIHPSMSVMTNSVSTQINITAKVLYNNKFWGGVNYRLQESIGIMAGVYIKDIRIGYAYDINTLGLSVVPGSHEISIGYCFKIQADKTAREYRNTRYL
ncbi:MAG: PorP/SprF family type IX secretion system membrane protein [Bacteroidetes bacterium]|nr:PorP/SprF family type IX secretion system membrane protein [Bacteroidota bacterium]